MFWKIVIGQSAECHVWVVADGGAHECRLALYAGRVFDRAPNVYLLGVSDPGVWDVARN